MVSGLKRKVLVAAAGLVLAGCATGPGSNWSSSLPKHMRPIQPETVALMSQKGMKASDPILMRAFKKESELEVWKRGRSGRYELLRTYKICAWGGTVGPKFVEGDKQSPEGFYTVTPTAMNPNSQFHLSFNVGYPNAFDRAHGRTGSAIMVHGDCSSAGCFAMTNQQMEDIYALAREAFRGGQPSFQMQVFPFRMTPRNLAENRRNPHMSFWRNIKDGYDHFELTRAEPRVEVCNRRYVFNPRSPTGEALDFNANGACPTFELPSDIAVAVAEKQKKDDAEKQIIVAQLEDAEQRAIAEKLERKLQQTPIGGTAIASARPAGTGLFAALGLGGAPADANQPGPTLAAAAALSDAPAGTPIPRPAPARAGVTTIATATSGAPASSAEPAVAVAAGPAATPAIPNTWFAGVFSFGASEPSRSSVVPAAVETTTTLTPAPAGTPLPQIRPVTAPVATTAPTPATSTPPAATLPATPAATEPSAPPPRPWWQRLNPFGSNEQAATPSPTQTLSAPTPTAPTREQHSAIPWPVGPDAPIAANAYAPLPKGDRAAF
jgi:murein L,D-transpeptidase YafK